MGWVGDVDPCVKGRRLPHGSPAKELCQQRADMSTITQDRNVQGNKSYPFYFLRRSFNHALLSSPASTALTLAPVTSHLDNPNSSPGCSPVPSLHLLSQRLPSNMEGHLCLSWNSAWRRRVLIATLSLCLWLSALSSYVLATPVTPHLHR